MSLYQITLAIHVHGTGSRGPAGWGAVVRRGDRAEVEDGARALLTSSLRSEPHLIDGPMTEVGRADAARAEALARAAAVVVGTLMEVDK